MCLIMFAFQAHVKYKLIVAANRDEFYKRPAAPAHYWEDHPYILAGRDLFKMGTWLGVTKAGRFAALTNYRNPMEVTEGKRSRGELVANFLKDNGHPENYMRDLAKKHSLYPGYNLLAGDTNELYYYSNIEDKVKLIEPGIHGISNHLLDSDWPKVERGKLGLSRIISESHGDLADRLLTFLQEAEPASDEMLPNTGVSLEWERMLSPIFIKSDNYGTRCSTVLLMTDEEIYFTEQVYTAEGKSDQQFILLK